MPLVQLARSGFLVPVDSKALIDGDGDHRLQGSMLAFWPSRLPSHERKFKLVTDICFRRPKTETKMREPRLQRLTRSRTESPAVQFVPTMRKQWVQWR